MVSALDSGSSGSDPGARFSKVVNGTLTESGRKHVIGGNFMSSSRLPE